MNPIRKIGALGRTYRHIKRYREILSVILKYGFGDILERLNVQKVMGFDSSLFAIKPLEKIVSLSRWERVRMIFEELGPSFIKIGQILSVRPDIVPPSLAAELEKLQDMVPPFPSEEARKIIEAELGKPISSFFRHLENKPIASASIAQVHKAVTLQGEEVAVKIQRPNIRSKITVDVEILFHLASLLEKYVVESRAFCPTRMVEEFARVIEKELDFNYEAANIERFARNFQFNPYIYVPKVYKELTTEKILTMEYIKGVKAEREALLEHGLDPILVANRGADLVLEQIFEHSFFHGDPHAGNIFVLPDNIICFLDYGVMGSLSNTVRNELNNFIVGIIFKDERKITRSLLKLSGINFYEKRESLEREIVEVMNQFLYVPLKSIKFAKIFSEMVRVMDKHGIRINPDTYLLLKAFATIEGMATELDPEFRLIEKIEPFAKRSIQRNLDPRKMAKDIFLSTSEINELIKDLPSDIKDILDMIKSGKINIELGYRGLEPMLREMDRVSNRLTFAIVLASLIVGSSLVVLSNIPPLIYDIPLLGVAGYTASAILGVWLLWDILKRGKI